MTNSLNIPPAKTTEASASLLPYNGNAANEKTMTFSFACFDRSHKLFNLGDNTSDGVISGKWFLDLLECLKCVSNQEISSLKHSTFDLHPIDWHKTNISAPPEADQYEYWQLRVNKSRGRIIGIKIRGLFYIVWFDPHHNLTNSEGYGTLTKYRAPESEYESNQREIKILREKVSYLEDELKVAEELLNKQ